MNIGGISRECRGAACCAPTDADAVISSRQPQQAVILLALAQQQISPGEPVGAPDAPGGVLHALLVDVDPALFDRSTRLALRRGEPGLDHGVDQRSAVPPR